MKLYRTIFPILLATSVSVFASSSRSSLDQEKEDKVATSKANSPESKLIKWIKLSQNDVRTQSSRMTCIPYEHTLIQSIVKDLHGQLKSRTGSLTITFQNLKLPEIEQYLAPYKKFMRQFGSLVTGANATLVWALDHKELYESSLAPICMRFLECLVQYEPTEELDLLNFCGGFFRASDYSEHVAFIQRNLHNFDQKKPLKGIITQEERWIQSCAAPFHKHTYTPLGSQTIIKLAKETSAQELRVALTTFEPFVKIKDAHYNPKSAKAFTLLSLWGKIDQDDPCTFHIPGDFFKNWNNADLFVKILATIEPTAEKGLDSFVVGFERSQNDDKEKQPYDITF